jgi:hypothetical protein
LIERMEARPEEIPGGFSLAHKPVTKQTASRRTFGLESGPLAHFLA